MSFEERNTVIYLGVSLAVLVLFGSRIWAGTVDGSFDGPGGLTAWARAILWMLPLAIGLTIASVIAGQIAYRVLTGERDMDIDGDERDTQVALRANRITMALFSLGWIGAIALLASGATALGALNLMLAAGWFADVAGNLAKLWLYRRGGWW